MSLSLVAALALAGAPDFHDWAATPPMGWNSWDCFGTGVTEAQVRENADYMAAKLRRHGWNVVTVDIDWFVPAAKGWNYLPGAEIAMDAFGRPLPAENRFPSAKGGKGFGPLADAVHAQGLKFGVHLLRGIPRKAVEKNLPVLGGNVRAADIADKASLCPWNPDMYGIDMTKPGAQAYYDSLFRLLASWGVDFVKVDDLSTPYHQAEIEAIRRAIDRSGRRMVLSTSPGPTGVDHGAHIQNHANLWRISDDFWDDWPALKAQFARLDAWTPYRGKGHWPDADMLPLGAVRTGGRDGWTRFTKDEQVTLMSLWSIARSPLFLGGHLPLNDAFTESLITNGEVIAVNQRSENNRQLWRRDDLVAWVADVPGSKDRYLALFNARDQKTFDPSRAAYRSEVVNRAKPSVEIDVDVTGAEKLYLVVDDAGDNFNWDHVAWVDPRLVGPSGETLLTTLDWVSATAGWGETRRDQAVAGGPIHVAGQPRKGIGTHANSTIEYTLPKGVTRFRALAALERAALAQPQGATVRFYVFTQSPLSGSDKSTASVSVDLKELGFEGEVEIRDLWSQRDLGKFTGEFTRDIPFHGGGLYRIVARASRPWVSRASRSGSGSKIPSLPHPKRWKGR
ncbi:MAG: NPCBM/NEW2 domain-containing protein [Fimbriimonas sp.]